MTTDATDTGFALLVDEPFEPDHAILVREGVRDMVSEWAESHGAELVRAAYLVLRDREEALECVQDAFVRALKAAERTLEVDNPRAWLHRITANVALNRLRSREREIRALTKLPIPEPHQDDDHEVRMRRDLVAKALDDLSEPLRALVVLRYYAGLTDREIAKAVGIPAGTVKSRLAAARAHLSRSSALAAANEEA